MTNRRNNEPPFVIFHLSFFIGHLPDLSLRPLRLCGYAFGLRLGFSVTSVVLRCEFVFFLLVFVAVLWSAQACLRFKGDGTFPPAPKRQQAAALQTAPGNSWPTETPRISRIPRKGTIQINWRCLTFMY